MPTATKTRKAIKLDEIDRKIVSELQRSSKITNATLAERVGISPPSTLERVRKLEANGVIEGYVAIVNPEAVNKPVQAIVHVSMSRHTRANLEKVKRALLAFDEVLACWHTAGDEDFVLRVVVRDMVEYEEFVTKRLSTVGFISRIRTAFVLNTVKFTTQIPLDAV
jgi:Lrp/AsnC family leucine-responsive transcriptional regulator